MPAPDIARDFALAEAAVREAGTLARAYFFAAQKTWAKGDDSPVSEADKAVDGLLARRLAGARPDYGWLSEETADNPARLDRARVWIVDPIDGTRAYLEGQSIWVVSVALVEDGVPVLGLVYNPMREQMFTAIAGGGAALNGQPIHVSSKTQMAGCRLLANAAQMKHPRWTLPWPQMDIRRYNALAYRIVMVAAGRHDATLTFSRFHEWDVAAPDLILSEAGGQMTTFEGDRFTYNQAIPQHDRAIAANPTLRSAFAAFIARSAEI
ncbi:MAG: 3'(2'),5'-bisphosphate nucleotidase CysQ [Hyphomicrobiales bacterium]